jgi:hypothetical protein
MTRLFYQVECHRDSPATVWDQGLSFRPASSKNAITRHLTERPRPGRNYLLEFHTESGDMEIRGNGLDPWFVINLPS